MTFALCGTSRIEVGCQVGVVEAGLEASEELLPAVDELTFAPPDRREVLPVTKRVRWLRAE